MQRFHYSTLTTGLLLGAAAAACFSLEGVLAATTMRHMSELSALAWRYVLAAGLGWAVWFLSGDRTPVSRRKHLWMLVVGGLGFTSTTLLLFYAYARIPTSLTIIILFTYPTLVTLANYLLGKEVVRWQRLLALSVTFSGLVLITGVSWHLTNHLALLAAVSAAVTNALVVLGTNQIVDEVPPLRATCEMASYAAVLILAMAAFGGQVVLPHPVSTWLLVGGLAVFPTLLAMSALNQSIALIGSSRAALVATLEPVFAATWGTVLLGEHLVWLQLLGAALIVAGVGIMVIEKEPDAELLPLAAQAEAPASTSCTLERD